MAERCSSQGCDGRREARTQGAFVAGGYGRDRGRSSRRSRPTSEARSRGVQRSPAAQPLFRQALHSGDGGSRTRSSSVQARRPSPWASSPRELVSQECGRVESNHHSRRRRVYSPLSSPLLSVRVKGRPTGFEPVPRGSPPRMLPLHHSHHDGDDRTRNGGLSPDKRALWPLSYAPEEVARVGFEPTSRAHEAREESRSSTARRVVQVWPAGVEPAVSGSRSRRGGRLPYGQTISRKSWNRTRPCPLSASRAATDTDLRAPAAGLEPAPHD